MFRFFVLVAVLGFALGAYIPEGLTPMLDGRIVGGESTTIEEFPHQISMRYLGSHRCGGSIISDRVIVSAAHCIDGISAEYIKIVVGSTSRISGGESYAVKKIVKHEQYNRVTIDYDISILILSDSLRFGDSVKPIELPKQGETTEEGSVALVSGWGAKREGSSGSEDLQFVSVNVINQRKCADSYKTTGGKITDRMLCAGAKNGGRDSCQGDSGGPLISGNLLIGVVSWGFGCARPQYPGIYARVSFFRDWISENSNN